jgi:hypothetical protein
MSQVPILQGASGTVDHALPQLATLSHLRDRKHSSAAFLHQTLRELQDRGKGFKNLTLELTSDLELTWPVASQGEGGAGM